MRENGPIFRDPLNHVSSQVHVFLSLPIHILQVCMFQSLISDILTPFSISVSMTLSLSLSSCRRFLRYSSPLLASHTGEEVERAAPYHVLGKATAITIVTDCNHSTNNNKRRTPTPSLSPATESAPIPTVTFVVHGGAHRPRRGPARKRARVASRRPKWPRVSLVRTALHL